MEWLFENWVLVLVFGGIAAMHLFGHGHGGRKHEKARKNHGVHEKKTGESADTDAASEDA